MSVGEIQQLVRKRSQYFFFFCKYLDIFFKNTYTYFFITFDFLFIHCNFQNSAPFKNNKKR